MFVDCLAALEGTIEDWSNWVQTKPTHFSTNLKSLTPSPAFFLPCIHAHFTASSAMIAWTKRLRDVSPPDSHTD